MQRSTEHAIARNAQQGLHDPQQRSVIGHPPLYIMPTLKLRTDHPVFVYKASRIERIVPQTILLSTPTTLDPSHILAFVLLNLLIVTFTQLLLFISLIQLKSLVVAHCS